MIKKAFISLLFVSIGAVLVLALGYRHQKSGDVAGSKTESRVHGLILPHHNQAGAFIASAVKQLASLADPHTIVVIAPNHFVPDGPSAIAGDVLGDFDIDTELVGQLSYISTDVVIDNELAAREHGLFVPMSYLAECFSKASFVPVMISPRYSEKALADLARVFDAVIPDNALFVISADFAHDMLYEEAMANTAYAAQVILDFDQKTVLTFDDRYMDAPVAMSLMMRIMSLRKAEAFQVWDMGHGAVLFDNPVLQGTSYLTGVFQEEWANQGPLSASAVAF